VAGLPESYFRKPDEQVWAERFGVAVADDGSFDYRALVERAVRAGSTPNGVFAARIMWGSMHLIVDGLHSPPRSQRDIDVLTDAFGSLLFVHLRRDDVLGQAVSWARAAQTDYWQQGDASSAEPTLDLEQIDDLVRTITEHNTAWTNWFAEQSIQPHVVTYEDVVAHPGHTVHGMLNTLGVDAPENWQPDSRHHRQADAINADWIRCYRSAKR